MKRKRESTINKDMIQEELKRHKINYKDLYDNEKKPLTPDIESDVESHVSSRINATARHLTAIIQFSSEGKDLKIQKAAMYQNVQGVYDKEKLISTARVKDLSSIQNPETVNIQDCSHIDASHLWGPGYTGVDTDSTDHFQAKTEPMPKAFNIGLERKIDDLQYNAALEAEAIGKAWQKDSEFTNLDNLEKYRRCQEYAMKLTIDHFNDLLEKLKSDKTVDTWYQLALEKAMCDFLEECEKLELA